MLIYSLKIGLVNLGQMRKYVKYWSYLMEMHRLVMNSSHGIDLWMCPRLSILRKRSVCSMVSWKECHFEIYFYQWHHEHFHGKWIETFFSGPYGHNLRNNLFINKLSPESMKTSRQQEVFKKPQWNLGQDTVNSFKNIYIEFINIVHKVLISLFRHQSPR